MTAYSDKVLGPTKKMNATILNLPIVMLLVVGYCACQSKMGPHDRDENALIELANAIYHYECSGYGNMSTMNPEEMMQALAGKKAGGRVQFYDFEGSIGRVRFKDARFVTRAGKEIRVYFSPTQIVTAIVEPAEDGHDGERITMTRVKKRELPSP